LNASHHSQVQSLPSLQLVIWVRTFFIVEQWGKLHWGRCPLEGASFSRWWHLCAWSRRTSCCWMSFRFSGSWAPGCGPPDMGPPGPWPGCIGPPFISGGPEMGPLWLIPLTKGDPAGNCCCGGPPEPFMFPCGILGIPPPINGDPSMATPPPPLLFRGSWQTTTIQSTKLSQVKSVYSHCRFQTDLTQSCSSFGDRRDVASAEETDWGRQEVHWRTDPLHLEVLSCAFEDCSCRRNRHRSLRNCSEDQPSAKSEDDSYQLKIGHPQRGNFSLTIRIIPEFCGMELGWIIPALPFLFSIMAWPLGPIPGTTCLCITPWCWPGILSWPLTIAPWCLGPPDICGMRTWGLTDGLFTPIGP